MNCLYTLNVKNAKGWNTPFVTDRVRRSFIAACYRWGCNYAEINHFNPESKICHWGKMHGPKYLIGYDALLYLDGDMIINENAPNPFELCTDDDTVYCVTDAQGVNPNPLWEACIYGAGMNEIIQKYPHFKKPPIREYFNAGFMMFRNTDAIRKAFDIVDKNQTLECSVVHEQTTVNMVVFNLLKVVLLPEVWNYIVWERKENPDAYINHYIGSGPSLM